ncbi:MULTISPECIES: carbohydrate ABC transporter permease [Sellimonas]|uniref:Sugar ABC transporter permease n=1 Tax=Sellimonas caecigallum TaxID=2592333 RepID=A0ABS7L8K0_9FIRM|nr:MULTISPECIES: sugar ABC transporter permease [Sellimonas]MBY0759431.1 sugar ABC transporter permease [Sellimonas caecigallum]OUP02205.1 lactose ABC transporter permease [Drancourtella sp. An210]OUP65893.1 lactose ABC transporter permease [Drancourtella sp. An177]
MNRKTSKSWFRLASNGWAFVLPSIVLFLWLVLWPMISAFLMSLQKGKGTVTEFAGLDNYIRLFHDPVFISSTINTITYFIIQVPIMLILALIISSILNNPRLRFRGFFRTAIFVPCVTSLVAYSLLFKSMFAPDGIINQVLMAMHIISEPIPWLLETFWAKVVIIFAITWRWTGYNMIFYLSSMQNIDKGVYEAAEIDGAGAWHKFWYITVPLLKPVILLTAIQSTTGTLQLFDEVVNITSGGPANSTMTISQYIYNLSFKYAPDFGYASTVSYAIFIMVAVLSLIQMKVSGDRNDK